MLQSFLPSQTEARKTWADIDYFPFSGHRIFANIGDSRLEQFTILTADVESLNYGSNAALCSPNWQDHRRNRMGIGKSTYHISISSALIVENVMDIRQLASVRGIYWRTSGYPLFHPKKFWQKWIFFCTSLLYLKRNASTILTANDRYMFILCLCTGSCWSISL